MKTKFKRLIATAATALLCLGAALGSVNAAEPKNYLLATASTGGTYYPVGVAIATLTKVKLQPTNGIGMSAINSAGSGENVKLLRENEVQFAIIQGLYGKQAWNGTGALEGQGPQRHLRSISMLWQNVEQFVVQKKLAKTGTIEDLVSLKGQPMAMGTKNSGTLGSNSTILEGFGLNLDKDFELVYAGYGPSAEALQDGRVAGIGAPAGVPTGAVTKLMAAAGEDVVMLEFTDKQIEQANNGLELWTRYVIPAGTYPGQGKAINTIAQPNFLAVRDDVDEESVYLITKTLFENLGFLQNIHKATKAMALESALAGLPVPLHPGAARYFREAGVKVPERLLAAK